MTAIWSLSRGQSEGDVDTIKQTQLLISLKARHPNKHRSDSVNEINEKSASQSCHTSQLHSLATQVSFTVLPHSSSGGMTRLTKSPTTHGQKDSSTGGGQPERKYVDR